MKKIITICLVACLMLSMVAALTSCESYTINTSLASGYIADFAHAISIKDYNQAKTYLHPTYQSIDIAANMAEVPAAYAAFDITLPNVTLSYTETFNGTAESSYTEYYDFIADQRVVTLKFTVINNALGIGISDFDIDPLG